MRNVVIICALLFAVATGVMGQTTQEDVLGIHNLGPGSPGPVSSLAAGLPILPRSTLGTEQQQSAQPAAMEPEAFHGIELHALFKSDRGESGNGADAGIGQQPMPELPRWNGCARNERALRQPSDDRHHEQPGLISGNAAGHPSL